MPANNLRMFVLNTSRPLFKNNPKLRQAINFAVDRQDLLRERGPLAGTLTDQYLPPGLPGFTGRAHLPAEDTRPREGKALALGNPQRQAVLYTTETPSASPRRRSSRTT